MILQKILGNFLIFSQLGSSIRLRSWSCALTNMLKRKKKENIMKETKVPLLFSCKGEESLSVGSRFAVHNKDPSGPVSCSALFYIPRIAPGAPRWTGCENRHPPTCYFVKHHGGQGTRDFRRARLSPRTLRQNYRNHDRSGSLATRRSYTKLHSRLHDVYTTNLFFLSTL